MDQHTDEPEWLEADGLGGYAMGTVLGERTRRYHGLLIAARTPPTDRVVLVAGLEVADGDAPQLPGGCPFQAWSVGELLRLLAMTTPIAARSAPPVRRPSDPRPMVTP